MMVEEMVLVTGASGFIATHIVKQLQEAGYRVRGTVRSTSNEQKVAPLRKLCSTARYPLHLVEADLSKEAGWEDAVKGCKYVIHVASPFPLETPKNEDEVIKPAVDGTLHVLRACAKSGTVMRVVLTSSIASVSGGFLGGERPYTESDWTDLKDPRCMPYIKSKTLAEKAAWDFLQELPTGQKFGLAVINPAFVIGPVLCGGAPTSAAVIRRILERHLPLVPRLNFTCIDVRDVATAHIKAMTLPGAAGCRHIIAHTNHWMREIGQILGSEFTAHGYRPTTSVAPNMMIRIARLFDSSISQVIDSLDKETFFDTTRMKLDLGIDPVDIHTSIIDMAYSMIENGLAKKMPQYKGRL